MLQVDNGIREKPWAGVGKRDGADFRRRDGHKDKKGRDAHAAAGDDTVPAGPEEGGRGHRRDEREGEDRRKGGRGDREHGDDMQRHRGARQLDDNSGRGEHADADNHKPSERGGMEAGAGRGGGEEAGVPECEVVEDERGGGRGGGAVGRSERHGGRKHGDAASVPGGEGARGRRGIREAPGDGEERDGEREVVAPGGQAGDSARGEPAVHLHGAQRVVQLREEQQ